MSSRQPKSRSSDGEKWSSGRRLTSAQRERKRAIDRLRAKERRTQVADHVAGLEYRVSQLSAELERAYTGASQHVESPENIHEGLLLQNGCDFTHFQGSGYTPSDISTSLCVIPATGWVPAVLPDPSNVVESSPYSMQPEMSTTISASKLPPQSISGSLPKTKLDVNAETTRGTEQLTGCKRREKALAGNDCQSIFNDAVTMARGLSSTTVCGDPSLNQDVLVRGVLFGWEIATTASPNQWRCPLLQILQLLDRRIFHLSGTITRLCALRMIHLLLLCLVKAASYETLPPWYRPRPSQYYLSHALAIDVLPWPGLRERAVLCQKLTQTNKFWTEVIYLFRFSWPYTVRDVLSLNSDTGLYEFSGMFNNYLYEIQRWRMDLKFFESFPETYDDIIPAEVIERPLHLASSEKVSACWDAPRGALLLPLPQDIHEEDVDSEWLDGFCSRSCMGNWEAGCWKQLIMGHSKPININIDDEPQACLVN
ncbi:hypothetical protein PV08_02261 [Exophiala spinifera]|uniref:BZIP domain-containing protein n=1 Tax=Exophiala spinifera TaxID=91928 RepID=A0A0D1Z1Z0_9EURO|nr:uncharacterized protein PV08_02261 [Exophiala spinifera]KIW21681.1 hypothetical protein PV08_02261 [Exophiala spinifera]